MSQPLELAGKNVHLLLIGDRPHAFQPAIDDLCMLPLIPQREAEKVNLSFL